MQTRHRPFMPILLERVKLFLNVTRQHFTFVNAAAAVCVMATSSSLFPADRSPASLVVVKKPPCRKCTTTKVVAAPRQPALVPIPEATKQPTLIPALAEQWALETRENGSVPTN